MNILLTGASSLSGCWFARELVNAGHNVTATFLRRPEDYSEPWRKRFNILPVQVIQHFNVRFGSRAFMRVISQQSHWDILCHHAAKSSNVRSQEFDFTTALTENTKNLPAILKLLQQRGCCRIVLTGSYYEAGEGGQYNAHALYPYGLSKSLTTSCFQHYAYHYGMRLGHFVVPNSFGIFDKGRFFTYMINQWKNGNTAIVNTPDNLRDNIHVSLLTKAYSRFVSQLPASVGFSRLRPSGYIETQGAFARRCAREIRKRVNCPCHVKLMKQTDFSEPMKRINNQCPDKKALGWSEKQAWDDVSTFLL